MDANLTFTCDLSGTGSQDTCSYDGLHLIPSHMP